jgi:hypothetical protein
MTTALLPTGGIALIGAPDSDMASREAKSALMQAMHVEITQDIVDELLESARSGSLPQIVFGRTPVCVHTFPEACRVVEICCCCSVLDSDEMRKARLADHATTATQVRRQDPRPPEQLREPPVRTLQGQRCWQRRPRVCRAHQPQSDDAEGGRCDGGRRLCARTAQE